MTIFHYKARDSNGVEIIGELDAADQAAAMALLLEKGVFPVSINSGKADLKPTSSPLKKSISLPKRAKFGPKELASFTRQFEVMFAVGMPVDKILLTLSRQAEHPTILAVLEDIQKSVSGGTRLSEAFAKYPKYFNKLYTSMLEMGQSAGVLDKTLHEISNILRKEHSIRTKVKSALLYPKIVMFTVLIVTWGMLVFVFPPFKSFYADQNAVLPLPTRIVMAMSDMLIHSWYIPLAIVVVSYLVWRRAKKIPYVEHLLGKLALNIPVFGLLNRLASNARFGHLVAALYRVGLPLPQTLAIVGETLPNIIFREEVALLKEGVEHGQSLSLGMTKSKCFSLLMKETCAVGEQTGKLDTTLDATAGFYDTELDELLDNLSTLIEPFMLFILFGIVLLLALAVYLPIWNMSKAVLH
ncbi:MAG: type II secretion system F family protein [Myxococcota bacterium]